MLVREAARRMDEDALHVSAKGCEPPDARGTKSLCERLEVLLKAVSAK